ncbi:MAG: FHA domain-containing protein [Bdellovibrionota bacterium]|nr:FHA domain-containing protein [Bdellovibrionota bacterium]
MYKLVVVAGKMRGSEFVLEEGENSLGRDESCSIHFPVQGVSKKHFSISVTGDTCYISDLGSSNGTFLNGKAIKRATVTNGDKIALPDTIIQVVYVEEKKVVIHKRAQAEEDDEVDFMDPGNPPDSLVAKIFWAFKFKVMPILHGINEEYEWHHLFGILCAVFSVSAISLTIFPALQDSKNILIVETAKRGSSYADMVARMNNRALERRELEKVNVNFIKNEEGVKSFKLFDMQGRIVRPIEELNDNIGGDAFYSGALQWAIQTIDKKNAVLRKLLDDGEIGIAKKIMAFNPRTASEEAVGVIAIKFEPTALKVEAAKSRKAYLESLVTTSLVAIFFFGFVYYLTVRPIEEITFQIEEAIRGRRKNLDSRFLFRELSPLRNSINALLSRIRELNNEEDDEFAEEESDESYVRQLQEFMLGCAGPALILDSQKNLATINVEAEDVTGIRESASQGMSLLDVSRERGFAATIIELCDNSANNMGTNQQGEYDLQGIPYTIHVASLIGKDSFAKAFYITFVKVD